MSDVEGLWGGQESPQLRVPAPCIFQSCLCLLPLPLQPLGQHPLHGAAGPAGYRKCRVHFLLQRQSQTDGDAGEDRWAAMGTEKPRLTPAVLTESLPEYVAAGGRRQRRHWGNVLPRLWRWLYVTKVTCRPLTSARCGWPEHQAGSCVQLPRDSHNGHALSAPVQSTSGDEKRAASEEGQQPSTKHKAGWGSWGPWLCASAGAPQGRTGNPSSE